MVLGARLTTPLPPVFHCGNGASPFHGGISSTGKSNYLRQLRLLFVGFKTSLTLWIKGLSPFRDFTVSRIWYNSDAGIPRGNNPWKSFSDCAELSVLQPRISSSSPFRRFQKILTRAGSRCKRSCGAIPSQKRKSRYSFSGTSPCKVAHIIYLLLLLHQKKSFY